MRRICSGRREVVVVADGQIDLAGVERGVRLAGLVLIDAQLDPRMITGQAGGRRKQVGPDRAGERFPVRRGRPPYRVALEAPRRG